MKIANRKSLVMLVSLMSLPVIQSTHATGPTAVLATHKLKPEESAYLSELITLAGAHAAKLSTQLHAFFDTKGNKESYSAHVEKFGEILESVDGTIITPLETKLKATKSGEYKALLEKMLSIVMDLRANLVEAYSTFKQNEGKSFLSVTNALSNLKDKVGTRLPHLERKLKELHNSLLFCDAQLAQRIKKLQDTLPLIFEIKLSNLVVVTRVKQRLDY